MVHLLTFINFNGHKNSKSCCDDTTDCNMNPCDPRITGCLSSITSVININKEACDIGSFVTDQYIDKNTIKFGSILGSNLQNPLKYTFNGQWKGLVYILFQIDDIDADTHELIDILNSTASIKATLYQENSLTTLYSIQGAVSAINFTISVYCSENFYGNDCYKYCKSVPNQYDCDKSGLKKCHEHWFGDECSVFCKASNNSLDGHYNCTNIGEKKCHPNWYSDNCTIFCNQDIGYVCDSFGKKVCLDNYFGSDCSFYCHKNKNDHFNCSKNGQKICYKTWYGKDCNVSCIETNQFKCNLENGDKICNNNYFGILCDKYCHANESDHYNCDKLGQKICHNHYYGKDCTVYGKFSIVYLMASCL